MFGWLRQKFKPKGRGAACLEKNGFRVRFCIFSEVVKIAPPFECVEETSIYRQNVARFFNLVPQLLSFL